MKKGFIIAIDGPVASGKGTIAKKLSQTINALNFNSGGIYRAYARKLLSHGIHQNDEQAIQETLKPGEAEIIIDPENHDEFVITLEGVDVTEQLFIPEISMAASDFGKSKAFVEFISSELRRIAKKYESLGLGIIMEGRQIGTDVFPDADVKLFLTAELQTRSKRRYTQYQANNIARTIEEVITETSKRDEQDMSREFGALPRYPEKLGYVIIDNSKLTEQETLDAILTILQKKGIWIKK